MEPQLITSLMNISTRDRSKRKYGFSDHTAPTKLECLELVEKEKEVGSSRLAELMKIDLNHAARLLRGYWSEGLLHREPSTMGRGGIRYSFSLTETGRGELDYFKKQKNLKNLFRSFFKKFLNII